MKDLRISIQSDLLEGMRLKHWAAETQPGAINAAARLIIAAFRSGGKVIFLGNGGSAADAQHLAGELIGRFLKERRPLPALALTTNSSVLTALANDYGYDEVFPRQVAGLARRGDVVVGISTSGRSAGVNRAIQTAKKIGCKTIALSGGTGGTLSRLADIAITVPSGSSPRVQEVHIAVGHIICGLVEEAMFRK
jgi:D-sedoheptulose 7-phosphate isomerase